MVVQLKDGKILAILAQPWHSTAIQFQDRPRSTFVDFHWVIMSLAEYEKRAELAEKQILDLEKKFASLSANVSSSPGSSGFHCTD